MGRPPEAAPSWAPGTSSGDLAPIVTVRDVRPIDAYLWAVRLRVRNGKVVTLVIDRTLATSGTVAVCALAASILAETDPDIL